MSYSRSWKFVGFAICVSAWGLLPVGDAQTQPQSKPSSPATHPVSASQPVTAAKLVDDGSPLFFFVPDGEQPGHLRRAEDRGQKDAIILVLFSLTNDKANLSASDAPAIVFYVSPSVPKDSIVTVTVSQGEGKGFMCVSHQGLDAGLHKIVLKGADKTKPDVPLAVCISIDKTGDDDGLAVSGLLQMVGARDKSAPVVPTNKDNGSHKACFYDLVSADFDTIQSSGPKSSEARQRLWSLLKDSLDSKDSKSDTLVANPAEDLSKWTEPR